MAPRAVESRAVQRRLPHHRDPDGPTAPTAWAAGPSVHIARPASGGLARGRRDGMTDAGQQLAAGGVQHSPQIHRSGRRPRRHALHEKGFGEVEGADAGHIRLVEQGGADGPGRPRRDPAHGLGPVDLPAVGHDVGPEMTQRSAFGLGGNQFEQAQQQSDGRFLAATDEEILSAYHLVARTEGVFVEPASAASIAGLLKSIEDGWVAKGSTVVCTVTGNGLKDPDTALKGMPAVTPLPVDPSAVVEKLGLV